MILRALLVGVAGVCPPPPEHYGVRRVAGGVVVLLPPPGGAEVAAVPVGAGCAAAETHQCSRHSAAALSDALLRRERPADDDSGDATACFLPFPELPWKLCHRHDGCSVAELQPSRRHAAALTHYFTKNPAIEGNHNPTFELKSVDIVVDEDSGPYLLGDSYVFDIDDHNGQRQNVLFQVTNNNEKLFSVQPHIIGCSWTKCLGTVQQLLGHGALHFTPAPNAFGKALVEVIAIDDGYPDPVCDGPPPCTPASPTYVPCNPEPCTHSYPQYFWIEILPRNDNPGFTHKGDVSSPEDEATCHDDWATGVSPGPEGERFQEADGQTVTWTVTTSDTDLFTVQPFMVFNQGETTASLCYSPAPNKVGQTVVTVTLVDSGSPPLAADTVKITVTITEVNDPPTFTPGPNSIKVKEDSGTYSEVWARDMVPGPPEEVAAGQRLSGFQIRFEDTIQAALFTDEGKPTVDKATGVLSFTPAPNANTFRQPVKIFILLEDEVDPPLTSLETPEVEVLIVIEPVNDPPSFAPPADGAPITVLEDSLPGPIAWATRLCVGGSEPNCISSEADPAGEGQQVVFTVEMTGGQRELFDGVLGFPTVRSDGYVLFTPAPDKSGEAQFLVTMRDTGPEPNLGPAHPLRIVVVAVNDAPRMTQANTSFSAPEDSGPVIVHGFLTDVLPGPAEPDEWSQTVTCSVAATPASLFSPLGGHPQVEIGAGGVRASLLYTPAADRFGTAEAQVTCRDDGGTENGGVDKAIGPLFQIVVTGVPDSPAFVLPPEVVVLEDGAPQGHTLRSVVTNISAGPGETAETRFVVNASLPIFSAAPSISSRGTLTFTLLPDANGNATLTVTAYDAVPNPTNSSLPPLLMHPSATKTLLLAVMPVNDPPRVQYGRFGQTELVDACIAGEEAPAGGNCTRNVTGVFADVVAGPGDEESRQTLNYSVSVPEQVAAFISGARLTGTPSRVWAHPSAHAPPDLTFTLAANPRGTALPPTASLSVRFEDSGSGENSTTATVLVRLVEPPPVGGTPVRLVFERQPVEGGRGMILPVVLRMEDRYGKDAPAKAALHVDVVSLDRGTRWYYGGVLPTQVRSQYTVWNSSAREPGLYHLEASATLPDGTALSARSTSFVVSSRAVTASTTRVGGDMPQGALQSGASEHDIRQGTARVRVAAAEGTRWGNESGRQVRCAALPGASVNATTVVPTTPAPAATSQPAPVGNSGCNGQRDSCAAVALLLSKPPVQEPEAALSRCANETSSPAAATPSPTACGCAGQAWRAAYQSAGLGSESACAAHVRCVDPDCTQSRRASPLSTTVNCTAAVTADGSALLVQVSPAPDFDLTQDGALEVTVPSAGLNESLVSSPRVLVPIRAAPVVTVTPPEVSMAATELRRSATTITLAAAGAEWVDNVAPIAKAAFSLVSAGRRQRVLQSGFGASRDSLLSIVRHSPSTLHAVFGPDETYRPSDEERLRIDPTALAPALTTTDIPPELAPAAPAVLLTVAATNTTATVRDTGCQASGWEHAALVSAVVATVVCVAGAPAGGSVQATAVPVIAAAALQRLDTLPCGDPLRDVAAGMSWVLTPLAPGRESLAAMLAVVACVALSLAHATAACVVSCIQKVSIEEGMRQARCPSLLLPPQLFLLCGALHSAAKAAKPVACVTSGVATLCYCILWGFVLAILVRDKEPLAEEIPLEVTPGAASWKAATAWSSRPRGAVPGGVERFGFVFQTVRRRSPVWAWPPCALLLCGLLPCLLLGAMPPDATDDGEVVTGGKAAVAPATAAALLLLHLCGLATCPHYEPLFAVAEGATDVAVSTALALIADLRRSSDGQETTAGRRGDIAAVLLLAGLWLHSAGCGIALVNALRRERYAPATDVELTSPREVSGTLDTVPGALDAAPPNPILREWRAGRSVKSARASRLSSVGSVAAASVSTSSTAALSTLPRTAH